KEVKHVSNPLFILMNKPLKCVCTTSDPEGRTTVFDIIKTKTKLFSVGRLDFNTEGLLVITNDGETAQLIAHPTNKVKKVYKAKVRGAVNKNSIRKMTRGVVLEGVKYSFASIKLDRVTGMNSWVTITLLEGKNRQIHKVCEVTGHRLIKLKRVQFGKLLLGTLKPGKFRPLTPKEVTLLRTSPLKPIKKT
ncbi:MAG: pseudouridine synthase, partial [Nitrospinota bacterium]